VTKRGRYSTTFTCCIINIRLIIYFYFVTLEIIVSLRREKQSNITFVFLNKESVEFMKEVIGIKPTHRNILIYQVS
jgi:hypothetical protein